MPYTRLKPPSRALWEITYRCDLRCEHCLVDGGSKNDGELTSEEALSLVDQIAALGVDSVSLTGGEPFLRRDWIDIARRVRERGMQLRFATNGHMLSDDIIAQLLELGTMSVTVSIDGPQPLHDRLRHGPGDDIGPPSFERVVAALDRLRPTPIRSQVITTVARENLGELPYLHSLLKEHGVNRWVLQLAHRSGRLTEEKTSGMCAPIEPEQLPILADFIVERADDPDLPPSAFNSIGYLSRQEPILRGSGRTARYPIWQGCHCGKSVFGIEPDGGIKGCANQVGDPFVVGNIREEPLQTIWEDRARWFWLDPKPEQMTGECAGCPLAKHCHAGCTTLAYRSTGELFNNPYCLRRLEKQGKEAR